MCTHLVDQSRIESNAHERGSFWIGDADGAASCRFATRPVLRTQPGHPDRLTHPR